MQIETKTNLGVAPLKFILVHYKTTCDLFFLNEVAILATFVNNIIIFIQGYKGEAYLEQAKTSNGEQGQKSAILSQWTC